MAKRISRWTGGAEPRRLPLGQVHVEYSDSLHAHEHEREMLELGFVVTNTSSNHGPAGKLDVYYKFAPKEVE